MLKYEEIKDSMELIHKEWGSDGDKVIELCFANPLHIPYKEFLENCCACGGNWGGMLLSGIKWLRPEVWEAVPENMGHNSFFCICATLKLLGVLTDDYETER